MNRRLFLWVLILLMGARFVADAQELPVSDVNCWRLIHSQEIYEDNIIVLYKEGSNLRIDISFYQCSPYTTDFDITPILSKGSDGALDSLSVRIDPVVPDSLKNMNVLPQFCHVMFVIHDVDVKSIYLSCLWFEGKVALKEYVSLEDPGVSVTVDGVDYYVYQAKHFATLYNGRSANGDLDIPSEVSYEGKEYPVKTIKTQAFNGCSTLTSVTIPNSVTMIGSEAFKNCSNLSTINNGENVEVVNYNAFGGTPWYNNQPDGPIYFGKTLCACKGELPEGSDITVKEGTLYITLYTFYCHKGLTSITIPEGISFIDNTTFMGCQDLVSVRLPETLRTIDNEAFMGCTNLPSVQFPSHLKNICYAAFRNCLALTSINIPEGVEEMGQESFYGCNNLTDVTLPGSLKIIGTDAFSRCKSLSDIKIPENVEEISFRAFLGCVKLNSITLPKNLKSIGEAAFWGCSDLSTIVCNAQIPPVEKPNPDKAYIYTDVFYKVDKQNCKLYVPQGCEETYRASDLWKDFNIVEMGTGIDSLTPSPSPRERGAVDDLSGRKINSSFFTLHSSFIKKGIYIVNGRKVAVK